MIRKPKKNIYLDYAASSPVSKGVMRAMQPYFSNVFGNTESTHSFGQEAERAVGDARDILANALQVNFREIIFTGSATEANNLVLRGVLKASNISSPNIVISSIEHASIHNTAIALEKEGIEVRVAHPDKNGIISPETISKLLDEKTVLVSVMHGNNETGVVQPITAIAKAIAEFRVTRLRGQENLKSPTCAGRKVLFHTDVAQSFMYLGLHPHECGVDLATISSHKMYGPKGAAGLFVREGIKISSQLIGGEQERGLRAGTSDVPAIVGLGEAVREAEKNRKIRVKKINELKKRFWTLLKKNVKSAEMNGTISNSLPHILNVHFPQIRAEELVIALDMKGIAVSAGSACASRSTHSSRTIREIYQDEERARRSVRFSFGDGVNLKDLELVVRQIKDILKTSKS